MPRHSKNNTNASHFTSGERKMLADRWGSKSGRLGSDSIRKYDQCSLCLDEAYGPVVCSRGHLTCHECALTDYMHQVQENEKRMRELEELERRFEEEREAAKREARTKVLLDFERNSGASSSSLASSSAAKGVGSSNGVGKSAPVTIAQKARSSSPTLSSLPARIAEATRAAEDAAMAALAEEQAQAARAKFPSYWVPSLTPDLSNHQLSAENLEIKRKERAKLAKPRCLIGGEPGHATSTKQLVGVKFARSPDGERNICPSCRKGLSNASHLHVLRRCGHVYCALCISTLVPSSASSSDAKKDKASERESDAPAQCPECDTRIKVPTKDILKLHKEGTGHIGAGGVEVTKKGLAFLG